MSMHRAEDEVMDRPKVEVVPKDEVVGPQPPAFWIDRADDMAPYFALANRVIFDITIPLERVREVINWMNELQAARRERFFQAAFAAAQREFVAAVHNRQISYEDKKGAARNTPYADWHACWMAVQEPLNKNGLSVWHDPATMEPGKPIVVRCHLQGYGITRTVQVTLPHDSSGAKNQVQAMGSSLQYGRRYTGVSLLNITVEGDDLDDDGVAAGMIPPPIELSEEQVAAVRNLCDETNTKEDAIVAFFATKLKTNFKLLEDLPADLYDTVVKRLEAKKKEPAL